MAESIRQIKYGNFTPSKILFGDGTESKRVYVGDVMVWNKDSYSFTINPTLLNAESIEKSYNISVVSTNNDGTTLVPYTSTTSEDWITIQDNGNKIVINADDEPRENVTEDLNVQGDAYISNNGGNVNLPEIICTWSNTLNRNGIVTYNQGEDSGLSATLEIVQEPGNGVGTYHIQPQSSWLHVDENNNVTADQYPYPTLSRDGELKVISDLTGDEITLTVHQANVLEQKKEYGIFSTLTDNTLSLSCIETTGNAQIVICYRYYQINSETSERIPDTETSWVNTDYASWNVNTNIYFVGQPNSSIITTSSNEHQLNPKNGSLVYTLQPNDTIPSSELSSIRNVEITISQESDFFVNEGEIYNQYRIVDASPVEINAAGEAVNASINSQYRRYKVWNSDNAYEFFEGDNWLTDLDATFVSQSVSGFEFNYNALQISSIPNTDTSTKRVGVGRFISNRLMDGQSLYIDIEISQKYREKTNEYRFIDAELTVNGKAVESWSPNAADQSETFNIVSKVLRQYKWTDGNWYDNVSNTKENWDYSTNSIEWCNSSDNLSARTTTLHVLPNSTSDARDFIATITQKEDSHLYSSLSVVINVTQEAKEPVTPITPPLPTPFVPEDGKTRLTECQISVSPTLYSPDSSTQTKSDFVVNSTAIVEYLYTDGNWYPEANPYKIGYTATSDASWCTSSAQESESGATVSVSRNSDTTERNATVTLEQKYSNYDSSSKKTASIMVNQLSKTKVIPEQIKWENCSITATLPSYEFDYKGTTTATFEVISTADRWSLFTDGEYYQTSTAETLPYTSSPTSGEIRTDGLSTLTVTEYTAADPRTQEITFIQKDNNGVTTGATDVKVITQTGDAPIIPEEWENRNYVLKVTPSVWNIDAAAQTSSDFSYVSTKDTYQKWASGWKKMSTENVDVDIDPSSATGRIKITSATNGEISLSAEALDNPNNPDTKTVKIIQQESLEEGSIVVTQSAATIKQPEEFKFREDGYVFSVSPTALNWLQTETSEKTVAITSYGYKVYLYTDGVWRGKVDKTTTGDKVDFTLITVDTSTHWNITGSNLNRTFVPKNNADKDYDETITFKQLDLDGNETSKTATVELTHKLANKVIPEQTKRQNYSISITSPTNPLSVSVCTASSTNVEVLSTCDVWCLYDDGNYYYDRTEDVDYILSPSSKQAEYNYCYVDRNNIYTRNQYSTNVLSQTITATQNASEGKSDSLSVNVVADSKTNTRYESKIESVQIPNIPYQGTAVTAEVDNQIRSYRHWNSDGTIVDITSWSSDTAATVSSVFSSGDTNITTDGNVSISATQNDGSSERKAYFNFTNSRGAKRTNVEAIQVTNTYTKYKLEVSPTAHTFATPTNGSVNLTIVCKYCVCIGNTDGTWNDCDYTYEETGDVSYDKDNATATLPTNIHQTTALSGSVKLTPVDMSTTTGYAGSRPTVTISINGCADELISSSEYRITNASIPSISTQGTAVVATINCQQQDFKYWKSGGETDVQSITKGWYNITTPTDVNTLRISGDSNIQGDGLTISASSNVGDITSDTVYKLTVDGGKDDIAYNSADSDTMTVTQEYKIGNGRTSTNERSATFQFKVTFANNTTQTISDINATQLADSGAAITYPTVWSRDNVKNHTIVASGVNFVTLESVSNTDGVWSYSATWDSNEGTPITDTDYRLRLASTSLQLSYDETTKSTQAINEKMDIVGGREVSSNRTNTFSVSYNAENKNVSYTQDGDQGSTGSGTGIWYEDTEASITCDIPPAGFSVSINGNTITVTTDSNEATLKSRTTYNTDTTYTYSDYVLDIDDDPDDISYEGGYSSHVITATRTETKNVDITYEVIYNSTSDKNCSFTFVSSRAKECQLSVQQSGQTRPNEYPHSKGTVVTPNQEYTPNLTWCSGYPSGSGITAGTAPSMNFAVNRNRRQMLDGYNYNLTIGDIDTFDYQGGNKTPTLTFTKSESYHYDSGRSRVAKGKCYDSVSNLTTNEFEATQLGEPGDSTIYTTDPVIDNTSSATLNVSGEGFYSTDLTIRAFANTNKSKQTVYGLSIVPTYGSINVGNTITPEVVVEEATQTIISPTNARTGTAVYTHSKTVGGTILSVNVIPSSVSLLQNGDTTSSVTESGWHTSTVGYTSSSEDESIATVSNNIITGVSTGNTNVKFVCNGFPSGIDKSLETSFNVNVQPKTTRFTISHYLEGTTLSIADNDIYTSTVGETINIEGYRLNKDGYNYASCEPNSITLTETESENVGIIYYSMADIPFLIGTTTDYEFDESKQYCIKIKSVYKDIITDELYPLYTLNNDTPLDTMYFVNKDDITLTQSSYIDLMNLEGGQTASVSFKSSFTITGNSKRLLIKSATGVFGKFGNNDTPQRYCYVKLSQDYIAPMTTTSTVVLQVNHKDAYTDSSLATNTINTTYTVGQTVSPTRDLYSLVREFSGYVYNSIMSPSEITFVAGTNTLTIYYHRSLNYKIYHYLEGTETELHDVTSGTGLEGQTITPSNYKQDITDYVYSSSTSPFILTTETNVGKCYYNADISAVNVTLKSGSNLSGSKSVDFWVVKVEKGVLDTVNPIGTYHFENSYYNVNLTLPHLSTGSYLIYRSAASTGTTTVTQTMGYPSSATLGNSVGSTLPLSAIDGNVVSFSREETETGTGSEISCVTVAKTSSNPLTLKLNARLSSHSTANYSINVTNVVVSLDGVEVSDSCSISGPITITQGSTSGNDITVSLNNTDATNKTLGIIPNKCTYTLRNTNTGETLVSSCHNFVLV